MKEDSHKRLYKCIDRKEIPGCLGLGKKTEHRRIGVFELCCWRRLLRVPWARRSNQSILKEINPEYSLERLMPKLKVQYFGHLMWRADSLGKTLMLGKIEDKRRGRQQRMRWLDSITDSMDMDLSKLQETANNREPWCTAVHGVTTSQAQLSDWTKTTHLLRVFTSPVYLPLHCHLQFHCKFFSDGCQN